VFAKIEKYLYTLTEVLVFLLFVVMVILVFLQVYTRFLTDNSITWSEELSRFVMIWMIFLASTLTFRTNSHIAVDNVVKLFPSKIRVFIEVVAHLFMLAFIAVVLWGAFIVIPTTAIQTSPSNNIVMAYVYISIPISMAIIALEVLKRLYNMIHIIRGWIEHD